MIQIVENQMDDDACHAMHATTQSPKRNSIRTLEDIQVVVRTPHCILWSLSGRERTRPRRDPSSQNNSIRLRRHDRKRSETK
jgi:hypothetical protein